MRDVARVELGSADATSGALYNGRTAIGVGVVKQATANPLDVSSAVRTALPDILQTLPDGMSLDIAYDSSVFIDRSIDGVFQTIGERSEEHTSELHSLIRISYALFCLK